MYEYPDPPVGATNEYYRRYKEVPHARVYTPVEEEPRAGVDQPKSRARRKRRNALEETATRQFDKSKEIGRLEQIDWGQVIGRTVTLGVWIWGIKRTVWGIKRTVAWFINKPVADKRKKLERFRGRKLASFKVCEVVVAADMINPDDIDATLDSVGGLDVESQALASNIMLPLEHSHLFQSPLLHQPNGVLLYGLPGDKTLLAKAIAKAAGAALIVITPKMVQKKWDALLYNPEAESEKLVRAVFGLAIKVAPSIVLIDGFESVLGKCSDQDSEATAIKTAFMKEWDRLEFRGDAQVVVIGMTDQLSAVDPAVLHRFTLHFKVSPPDEVTREIILRRELQRHATTSSVDPRLLESPLVTAASTSLEYPTCGSTRTSQLQEVAAATEGYNCEDLTEACSRAALLPIKEHLAATSRSNAVARAGTSSSTTRFGAMGATLAPRPLSLRDFMAVVRKEGPSRVSMSAYTPTADDILAQSATLAWSDILERRDSLGRSDTLEQRGTLEQSHTLERNEPSDSLARIDSLGRDDTEAGWQRVT